MTRKCFLLLGMHRSGTSLLSKMVHNLGVDLGPKDEIMGPDDANPGGYYENYDFVRANNSILAHSGGHWNYLPSKDEILAGGRANKDEMEAAIERARKPVWGFKDNRTMVTFPAWEPLLRREGLRIVWIRRERDAVIRSLKRTHIAQFEEKDRNDEYLAGLIDQHETRFAAATLKDVDGAVIPRYPMLQLSYEKLHSDESEIRKLVRFIGQGTVEDARKAIIKDIIDV